jgi:hypothetical protein
MKSIRKSRGGGFVGRVKRVIKGQSQLPPASVRKKLKKYDNYIIFFGSVCRQPIDRLVDKALDVLTFGGLSKFKKKYNYDELFHLSINLGIGNEETKETLYIRIEKNEVIKFQTKPRLSLLKRTKNTECLQLDVRSKPTITFGELFRRVESKMGKQFAPYDPKYSNCQDFINQIVREGKWSSNEGLIFRFIKQPADELLKGFAGKVAKITTDIAGRVSTLVGGGFNKKSEIHSVVFDPAVYNTRQARRWLVKNKLSPIKRVHKVKPGGGTRITQLRYRIRDPDQFSRFITKKTGKGISLIIGFY